MAISTNSFWRIFLSLFCMPSWWSPSLGSWRRAIIDLFVLSFVLDKGRQPLDQLNWMFKVLRASVMALFLARNNAVRTVCVLCEKRISHRRTQISTCNASNSTSNLPRQTGIMGCDSIQRSAVNLVVETSAIWHISLSPASASLFSSTILEVSPWKLQKHRKTQPTLPVYFLPSSTPLDDR